MSEQGRNMPANRGAMGGRRGGPMGGFGMPVQKAKNFKVSLKRLIGYLRPHKINLIVVLIFAIASTTFTIAAPKVTSKAMNKLQDGYMSGKMLKEMAKGQNKAVDQINSKMADAQKEAVNSINDKMAEGQTKAVDQISSQMADAQKKASDGIIRQMGDAQVKAVDGIYDSMAAQLYSGLVDGQKLAVSRICTQMAQVQKGLLAQIKQMQQSAPQQPAPSQPVNPEMLKAMQQLMKLPLIDSIQDPAEKAQATLAFMEILEKMPPMPGSQQNPQAGQMMDARTLGAVKQLLKLPLIETVQDPDRKIAVVKEFLAVSKSMPGVGQQSSASPMKLDEAQMEKVYARIPYVKYTRSGSSSGKTMDQDAMEAVRELLALPMLNSIQDAGKKNETVLQLMDAFKKMPGTSDSRTSGTMDPKTMDTLEELIRFPLLDTITDPQKKLDATVQLMEIFKKMPSTKDGEGSSGLAKTMDPEALDTVRQLLKLPKLNTVTDPDQKAETVSRMIDLFAKMPDMGTEGKNASSDESMSPEAMKTLQELLQLPMLDTVKDPGQKAETVQKMLDIFSRMPEMKTGGHTQDSSKKMDPDSLNAMKEFLALPRLDTLTDPGQKADVSKKIMDLGKKMQSLMKDAPQSPNKNIKLTDEQIEGLYKAIRETNGKIDFQYIGWIALILIGMYLISALFTLIMGLVMSGVSQKTVRDLRREVDSKLARLPLKYFDMHPHGDILSRVTNDVDTIATTLQQSLTQVITSVVSIIGYIIMMLTISPVLTLIVIATLPLYVITTTLIAKNSQKFFAAQQKELGELSGHVEEMYTGHKMVKAFGRETDSIGKFETVNERLYQAGWKAQFVSGIMFPLLNFVSNLGYVMISIVGGLWITKDLLKIGDMLAFIQYSRSFTMPIVQTANIANVIQSTVACAERVFEVLDEEEEIPDSADAKVLRSPEGEVSFEQVDFRYKEDVPLIENMNLEVRKGHTIAIVGPTGAGKTTLVNLLMRFYEINAGKILIDGVDIRDIKRSELRKMFGMVLQDTWLFNGTIKDNIAYGKEGASMDEIVRAAKAAHAHHFIRTLPEGYNTVLNEEATNISQGQKQLLTIARAILADPAILILDEATSSVDTRTEVLIQKAMANLMEGRTSFVIAHRLSTIRDAELILVMNHGSIIEMGNHRELLAQNGFYAELYNSQFAKNNQEEAAS